MRRKLRTFGIGLAFAYLTPWAITAHYGDAAMQVFACNSMEREWHNEVADSTALTAWRQYEIANAYYCRPPRALAPLVVFESAGYDCGVLRGRRFVVYAFWFPGRDLGAFYANTLWSS